MTTNRRDPGVVAVCAAIWSAVAPRSVATASQSVLTVSFALFHVTIGFPPGPTRISPSPSAAQMSDISPAAIAFAAFSVAFASANRRTFSTSSAVASTCLPGFDRAHRRRQSSSFTGGGILSPTTNSSHHAVSRSCITRITSSSRSTRNISKCFLPRNRQATSAWSSFGSRPI